MSKDTLFRIGSMRYRAGDIAELDVRFGVVYVRLHGETERVTYTASGWEAKDIEPAWQAALLKDDLPKPDAATPKYARLTEFSDGRDTARGLYVDPNIVESIYQGSGDVPCIVACADGIKHFAAQHVERVLDALASPKTLAEWGEDDDDEPDA